MSDARRFDLEELAAGAHVADNVDIKNRTLRETNRRMVLAVFLVGIPVLAGAATVDVGYIHAHDESKCYVNGTRADGCIIADFYADATLLEMGWAALDPGQLYDRCQEQYVTCRPTWTEPDNPEQDQGDGNRTGSHGNTRGGSAV